MHDAEKQDLEKLLAEIVETKSSFYEMCKTIKRADDRQMETMGYGKFTKAEAMSRCFNHYEAKIDKALKAHTKKWPD